ncbi:hypothetical protein [uncultured Lacinutrix sp.]|uniref:hypothetical protein n=1 Tax=uncultured Lacinutrix sp. TaxID=574032 RepID=UPI0026151587|nr:hypothetical protein [uncultured Lacinutrix sp.]
MSLIKNLKKVSLLLMLFTMFTTNAMASSKVSDKPMAIEIEHLNAEFDSTDYILEHTCSVFCKDEHYGPGWDKFKKAVKDFWEGFLDGLEDGLGGQMNNNGGNITNQDMNYIKNFATNSVGNKENAMEMVYQMNKLILDTSSNVITKQQLLRVFKNDARILSIALGNNDSIYPLDKGDESPQMRINWNKVGRIVGLILGKIISSNIP